MTRRMEFGVSLVKQYGLAVTGRVECYTREEAAIHAEIMSAGEIVALVQRFDKYPEKEGDPRDEWKPVEFWTDGKRFVLAEESVPSMVRKYVNDVGKKAMDAVLDVALKEGKG